MKKELLKGTPVPTIVTVLFFVWALGFAGLLYLVYETNTHAQDISLESRFGSLFE